VLIDDEAANRPGIGFGARPAEVAVVEEIVHAEADLLVLLPDLDTDVRASQATDEVQIALIVVVCLWVPLDPREVIGVPGLLMKQDADPVLVQQLQQLVEGSFHGG
jgi:hypothetical protein